MQINNQLEQEYLVALERDYQQQKVLNLLAKSKFRNAARLIQTFYRKFKQRQMQIKIENAKILLIKCIKRRKMKLFIKYKHKIRLAFKKYRLQIRLMKTYNQLVNNIIDYNKDKLMKIFQFIKSLKIIQKKRQRELLQILVFYIKNDKEVQKSLLHIIDQKQQYYQRELRKCEQKIAITKEIEFIDNLIELNTKYYHKNWDKYQCQIEKQIDKQSETSNFIKQQDEYGEEYYLNMKTMKKSRKNPIQNIKTQNVEQLQSEANENFEEQLQYLKDGREQLYKLLNQIDLINQN